jgi:predicted metal-dependent peptidase
MEIPGAEEEEGEPTPSNSSLMTSALANSASLAKSIGEGSQGLHLLIDKLREPKVTWRELLRYESGRHLGKRGRSFKRPHRRSGAISHALGQTVILPGKNRQLDHVIVVFDLSCSVVGDRRMVEDACSELDVILNMFSHPSRVIFHESQVTADFEASKLVDVLDRLIGGGGTNFIPVYQHLAASEKSIPLVIWITDLFGKHWDAAPPFPIIWLTGHNHDDPPGWGKLIALPESRDP